MCECARACVKSCVCVCTRARSCMSICEWNSKLWFTTSFLLGGRCRKARLGVCVPVSVCYQFQNLRTAIHQYSYLCKRHPTPSDWSRSSQSHYQVVCSRCILPYPRCGWRRYMLPLSRTPLRRKCLCIAFASMTSVPALSMATDTRLLSSLIPHSKQRVTMDTVLVSIV